MRQFITGLSTQVFIWGLVLAGCVQAQTDLPKRAPTQPATTTSARVLLTLRVASYNTRYGAEKQNVLKNIQSVHPDVVLLQEIPPDTLRAFSRALGMNYQFGPYQPGASLGLGILTRGTLEPLRPPLGMPHERNFALVARLTYQGQRIIVISTHLKSLPRPLIKGVFQTMGPHQEQAKKILEVVREYKGPAVVGGDLNTLGITPAYLSLSANLKDTAAAVGTASQPSIYVGGEGYRIDRIFVRGPWKTRAAQVSPLRGSDHRLIWADLQLLSE
jgi:endonuclease/exonuclease/phosphatase family metal-dependent hydrolase